MKIIIILCILTKPKKQSNLPLMTKPHTLSLPFCFTNGFNVGKATFYPRIKYCRLSPPVQTQYHLGTTQNHPGPPWRNQRGTSSLLLIASGGSVPWLVAVTALFHWRGNFFGFQQRHSSKQTSGWEDVFKIYFFFSFKWGVAAVQIFTWMRRGLSGADVRRPHRLFRGVAIRTIGFWDMLQVLCLVRLITLETWFVSLGWISQLFRTLKYSNVWNSDLVIECSGLVNLDSEVDRSTSMSKVLARQKYLNFWNSDLVIDDLVLG